MKILKVIYRFFFPKIDKTLFILKGGKYFEELCLRSVKGLLLYLLFAPLLFFNFLLGSIFEYILFIMMAITYLFFIGHHLIRGFFLLRNRLISLGYSPNDVIFFYIPIINIIYSVVQGKFKLAAIYMFIFPIFSKSFGIENLKSKYKKKKKEIVRKYQEIKFEYAKYNKEFNKVDIENQMKTELNSTKDEIINNFVEKSLEQKKYSMDLDYFDIEKKKFKTIATYLID
jgi:hypothetical protein